MGKEPKTTVVVTGFGLFRDYELNPSWEAVKRLQIDSPEIDLVKVEVPVIYEVAEKEVERIWSQYTPALVVHCGVSHLADRLTLEKRAVQNVERYCSLDVASCRPCQADPSACSSPNFLYTGLDLEAVCQEVASHVEQGQLAISACVSNRAGEYLCEYIYRCSLQKDPQRTLFIHVPKVTDELTIEVIASGLQKVIESILKQVSSPPSSSSK